MNHEQKEIEYWELRARADIAAFYAMVQSDLATYVMECVTRNTSPSIDGFKAYMDTQTEEVIRKDE